MRINIKKETLANTRVPIIFWIQIATDTTCPRNDTEAESSAQTRASKGDPRTSRG